MTFDHSAPDVSVVIATRDREELLQKALASIARQNYDGSLTVILVYDQARPQAQHVRDDPHREVRVISNTRTPGLAGARNSGICVAEGQLLAFCDDDDSWRPDKLRRQVEAMNSSSAIASVTGIAVHYDGAEQVRIPPVEELSVESLSRSRMTGAHPSSYVMNRREVAARVGLVDEDIPGGYGEDYDWLLRLASAGKVAVVQEPLVDVLWHRGSYFTNRWQTIVDALDYMAHKHPSIMADRRGRARVLGQQAFALAALGQHRMAMRTAAEALRSNPTERRAYIAAMVSTRIVSAETVVHAANRRGRGI